MAEKSKSQQGEWVRISLIERSGITFESFLGREFANRFYTDEFLTGISARRLEAHARIGKASGLAFILATVIAFFDLVAGSNFSYGGLSVRITKDLSPIVSLFAAGAILQTTFAFIDEQILFRILLKIGNNIKIQSFPLLLVDKAAINLWGDAITPRFFGPKSGRGQKIAMALLTIVATVAGAGMYLYPPAMVGFAAYQTLSDDNARLVAKGIACLASIVVIWALILLLVCSLKFRFYPADWIESTDQPTEEFAARMRAELANEGAPPENEKEG